MEELFLLETGPVSDFLTLRRLMLRILCVFPRRTVFDLVKSGEVVSLTESFWVGL